MRVTRSLIVFSALMIALAGCVPGGKIVVTKEYKKDKDTCYTIKDSTLPPTTTYDWCSTVGDIYDVNQELPQGWSRVDGVDGYVPKN